MKKTFSPIFATNRIALIDALRGFALLGVLLANLSSFAFPDETQSWVNASVSILINTKFITLFTILFGAGFYYQWQRLREFENFQSFYLKRMFWLFVIGSLHAHLFWYGDILRVYSLCGAALLLFPLLNHRAVLGWAIAFSVPFTAIAFIAQGVTPYLTSYYPESEEISNAFKHGNYTAVLSMNWYIDPIRHFLKDSVLTVVAALGKMLIGVWLAQRGFFLKPNSFQSMQRTWLLIGATLGIASSVIFWSIQSEYFSIDSPVLLWVPFVVSGGLILHGLLYLTLFVNWFTKFQNSTLSLLMQSTGRMALTNYIVQTFLGIILFYGVGFGLAGKLTSAQMLLCGMVQFALQMLLSHAYLKRFKLGPVEWLWRKLSY